MFWIIRFAQLSVHPSPPLTAITDSALYLCHNNTLYAVTHCSVCSTATSYHGQAIVRINVKILRFTMCQLFMLTEYETPQIH